MTRRLAVLGDPVAHSRSPAMQNAALRELGLAGEWTNEAIQMPPADFPELTRALPAEGFVGANVTIPHKEAALALASNASPAANEIGAANTLTFGDADEIRADNTDAPGLIAALEKPPSGTRALILGAGGSARAAAWALVGQGASVDIWNRTAERADELVRDIGRTLGGGGDGPLLAPVSAEQAKAGGYAIVVNCTAVGLGGEVDPFALLPVEPDSFADGVTLVDFVYGSAETALAASAREHGAHVIDGIELLVRQGAESLRIWTGMEPPLETMREAARAG